MKFTAAEMLANLPLPANDKWKDGVFDVEPFKKGSVSLVYFAPRGIDYQTSHDDDEFYFIVSGTATLIIDGERNSCAIGDAFYVAAGVPHHFEDITDTFGTWAVFFQA